MTMKAVVTKHLCLVLIVSLLSVMNGKATGNVITRDEDLQPQARSCDVCDDDDGETNQPTIIIQNMPYTGNGKCCEEAPACQDGFIMLASRKCYMFSIIERTWQQAQALCQRSKATLAFPVNDVENTVLATYLKTTFNGLQGWWLGANDLVKPFQWLLAQNNASMRYFDWAPGQPDNNKGVERCVQVFS